jgi:serine/threonine-protein kinase HipA
MTDTAAAEVRLHGIRVGELRFDRGGSTFRYEDVLDGKGHRVLGQVFEDDPRTVRRVRVGLPPWFANLLPEGELRRQIVRDLGGGMVGDYTLLMRLGRYLPGAVTVHGDQEPSEDPPATPDQLPDHPLRHSQAGVQLKYTTTSDRLTFPATGNGGWWTVKLPDTSLRDLVVNEYLTMRWLAAAGFLVPPIHLEPACSVGGIPAGLVDPVDLLYLIERFDRTPHGRIHFEDFAQVADVAPSFKYSESGATYDSLAGVVRYLTGPAGYRDYVARLTAMIITGNVDAHLKNWALVYRDGRTPGLAPVYDFHSLTVYGPYRHAPLALSLNAERLPASIDMDDFRRLADTAGADPELTVEHVSDAVRRLRSAWTEEMRAESERRFPDLARHYTQRLNTLPLAQLP